MAAIVDFCTPPVPGETHKYYGNTHNHFIKLPQFTTKPEEPPSPATPTPVNKKTEEQQQKTLHSVASTGNLIILKQILLLLPDPLKALNDPHPSTGLTPIHFASSRGHVDIVRCLVEEYQVSLDSRDKEGEVTSEHFGLFFLVPDLLCFARRLYSRRRMQAIIMWSSICFRKKPMFTKRTRTVGRPCTMHAHAAFSPSLVSLSSEVLASMPATRWVIPRSVCPPPLPFSYLLCRFHRVTDSLLSFSTVNAASKGYMSIVEYLLDEAHANPLIKNSFGEAAYDVSAASGEAGEAYICEMLERAGSRWWHMQHTEGMGSILYEAGSRC